MHHISLQGAVWRTSPGLKVRLCWRDCRIGSGRELRGWRGVCQPQAAEGPNLNRWHSHAGVLRSPRQEMRAREDAARPVRGCRSHGVGHI